MTQPPDTEKAAVTPEREKILEFMDRLEKDENAQPPDGVHVHITKARPPCAHEWNNGGCNPEYCLKCGIGFMTYAMTECP